MSKVFDALTITGYVLFVGFVGWSALNPASVNQAACLISFGVLCALPGYIAGRFIGDSHVQADSC